MRRYKHSFLIILILAAGLMLNGCNNTDEGADDALGSDNATGAGNEAGADIAADSGNESGEAVSKDPYDEYIHAALDAVSKDGNTASKDEQTEADKGKVVQLKDSDDTVYVSSEEQLLEDSGIVPDFSATPTPVSAEAGSEDLQASAADATPTPTPTPTVTPETFEVGKCCIYVKCEEDAAYGTEVVTAINKARTDLGYPALNENSSLATCANRRTREIYTRLSHIRPNNLPFYSLAPEYFKAEMLAIDTSDSDVTFDAWMMDPVSRALIYTTKYTSVGAYAIKCNGMNCVVVAFGN